MTNTKMDEYITRIEKINPDLPKDQQLWVCWHKNHIELWITDGNEVNVVAIDDKKTRTYEIDQYLSVLEIILERRKRFKC